MGQKQIIQITNVHAHTGINSLTMFKKSNDPCKGKQDNMRIYLQKLLGLITLQRSCLTSYNLRQNTAGKGTGAKGYILHGIS